MKYSTISALLFALASKALAAETITLQVSSSNEVNGDYLYSTHEGAGINYLFLSSSGGEELTYDGTSSLSVTNIGYPQAFTVEGGFVALSVASGSADVTFSDSGVLSVNGSPDGFYACKNTEDPYQYSTSSYEVMYYTSDAPDGCLAIKLVSSGSSTGSSSAAASSASSTVVPTTTAAPTISTVVTQSTSVSTVCPSCTISTYEGFACDSKPAGLAAAGFALAAAMLI